MEHTTDNPYHSSRVLGGVAISWNTATVPYAMQSILPRHVRHPMDQQSPCAATIPEMSGGILLD